MPITFNVLVSELDKRRFHRGEKGLYANLVLYETEGKAAEYGDYIVKQQGEEGDRMPILGNGKYWPKKSRGRSGGGGGGGWRRGRDSSGAGNRRRDDDRGHTRRRDDEPNGGGHEEEDEIPF